MLSSPTSVKLSCCLVKQHTITKYGGIKVYLHIFLTLALGGGERSVHGSVLA